MTNAAVRIDSIELTLPLIYLWGVSNIFLKEI